MKADKSTQRQPAARRQSLRLRRGELVEVRSAAEILATLDETGAIDGLPCMPELLEYCGRRLRVEARADKTCDTINYSGSRRMYDTVHLEGARCSGAAHGGCQAQCSIFWKEAWLKRVSGSSGTAGNEAGPDTTGAHCTSGGSETDAVTMDRERLEALARRDAGGTEIRYRCQATDLLLASTPLPWWDLRQYWRDLRSGNVGAMALLRALAFRVFVKLTKIGGYRALLSLYNRLQHRRGGTPYPFLQGTLEKTPHETLGLKPGEYVRIKSQQEILSTVDRRNRNRGLSFDAEMVRYCGKVHRVRTRVERVIDERSGRMIRISSDCIILDDVVCCAEYSDKRLFCPRRLYPFWREIWLERLPETDSQARSASSS